MPTLVDAVETVLSTDFAILMAVQEGVAGNPGASFANSTAGCVSLEAGSKYSRIPIRAERWDGSPPPTEGWEEFLDLPFIEVPTAGKLMLSGFDPGEVGLDVSGLGSARVQVFARGHHRYTYSARVDVDAIEREEWLLRFYPRPIRPTL